MCEHGESNLAPGAVDPATGKALEISVLPGIGEAQLDRLAAKFVQLLGVVALHVSFVGVDKFFVLAAS